MKTLREIVYERILYDGRIKLFTDYIFCSSDSKSDIEKRLRKKHPDAVFKHQTDTGVPAIKRTLDDINSSIEKDQRKCYREHKLRSPDGGFWGNYCVYADPVEDVDKYTEDDIYEYTKHFTEGKPSKGDYNGIIRAMEKEFPYIDEYRVMVRSTYYVNQFDPEPTMIDSVEEVAVVNKDLEIS